MNDKPQILGVDNVMFLVADLDASIRFYEMCGLVLKFRLEPPGIALVSIGDEAAGLLIRRGEGGPANFGLRSVTLPAQRKAFRRWVLRQLELRP